MVFTGDAGFWYHIGEVETAVRWNIPSVTIVNNNGGGNHFTMGFGGGVDVAAGDNFAVRVIQFDWLPTKGEPTWLKNNLRFGFGVVWKSGS